MRLELRLTIVAGVLLSCGVVRAPDAVVAAPDALFHSSDPTLNANKQAAYHIMMDLIEAGHWEPSEQVSDRALHTT